jgi:hypothetical protein
LDIAQILPGMVLQEFFASPSRAANMSETCRHPARHAIIRRLRFRSGESERKSRGETVPQCASLHPHRRHRPLTPLHRRMARKPATSTGTLSPRVRCFRTEDTMEMIMKHLLKLAAAGALLAAGATISLAQTDTKTTPSDSPSKAEKGSPDQGPGKQGPSVGTGSRPIGPPATEQMAPGKNPTGQSVEKKKSEANDPQSGSGAPK